MGKTADMRPKKGKPMDKVRVLIDLRTWEMMWMMAAAFMLALSWGAIDDCQLCLKIQKACGMVKRMHWRFMAGMIFRYAPDMESIVGTAGLGLKANPIRAA